MRISEITEYNAISNLVKSAKKSLGPSRKEIWAKRLAPRPEEPTAAPAEPAAPVSPAKSGATVGASFVQPTQATATAKAASVATPVTAVPQAKPRMSVRAATGPAYAVGQRITVGGVFYTWDGQVWRDPKGNPATQGITAAISQQSSQTS